MTLLQRAIKRMFDVILAIILLLLTWPILLIAMLIARIDCKASGLFSQRRIGRHGKPFTIYKIRTMRANDASKEGYVTASNDARISKSGAFFRKSKIDELPQLWNIIIGEMSFIGPRPDMPGYADKLSGDDRAVLQLRPGITGPATLKYRNEEDILAAQNDPQAYNDTVLWPDKVAINRAYLDNYSFFEDLHLLWRTISGT